MLPKQYMWYSEDMTQGTNKLTEYLVVTETVITIHGAILDFKKADFVTIKHCQYHLENTSLMFEFSQFCEIHKLYS